MRRIRLLPACLLALTACGTEIDADRSAVQMAAALSLDHLAPATDSLDPAERDDGYAVPPPPPSTGVAAALSAAPAQLVTALYAENDVEVGARAMGAVQELHAELGDAVEAGAILAVLEDGVERAAVAAAEAELDLVRAEHARVALLTQQGGMTTAELEQAVYRLRAAEAALADAVARLEHKRVRAPFAGLVSRRFARLGQFVEEGDPLFRVTAMAPLRALVRVPELAARRIRRGERLTLRALDGREVAGRVARVAPAIDPASGTVEILLDVPDPAGLRPGATVSAHFADE